MASDTIFCIVIAIISPYSIARGIQPSRTTSSSLHSTTIEKDYDGFRSLVLISVTIRNRKEIVCGGSYIPPEFVVTSAYCAEKRRSIAVMGADGTESPARRKVIETYRHPCFRSFGHNDIALLKIDRPFGLGMQPSPLPVEPNYYMEADKPDLFLASLGYKRGYEEEEVELDGTLTNIKLSYTYFERCRQAHIENLKEKYQPVVNNMHFCGGGVGSIKTCNPARGDPVFADGLLVGLVTKQRGCGRQGIPYLLTRVDTYMPWILNITKIHLS